MQNCERISVQRVHSPLRIQEDLEAKNEVFLGKNKVAPWRCFYRTYWQHNARVFSWLSCFADLPVPPCSTKADTLHHNEISRDKTPNKNHSNCHSMQPDGVVHHQTHSQPWHYCKVFRLKQKTSNIFSSWDKISAHMSNRPSWAGKETSTKLRCFFARRSTSGVERGIIIIVGRWKISFCRYDWSESIHIPSSNCGMNRKTSRAAAAFSETDRRVAAVERGWLFQQEDFFRGILSQDFFPFVEFRDSMMQIFHVLGIWTRNLRINSMTGSKHPSIARKRASTCILTILSCGTRSSAIRKNIRKIDTARARSQGWNEKRVKRTVSMACSDLKRIQIPLNPLPWDISSVWSKIFCKSRVSSISNISARYLHKPLSLSGQMCATAQMSHIWRNQRYHLVNKKYFGVGTFINRKNLSTNLASVMSSNSWPTKKLPVKPNCFRQTHNWPTGLVPLFLCLFEHSADESFELTLLFQERKKNLW